MMTENTDLNLTTEAWAKIVIDRWRQKIDQMRISNLDYLRESFLWEVHRNAQGDPDKIGFAFNYYGKFVDMGVGNGITLEMQRNKGSGWNFKRRPKPWYTKTFAREIAKLAGLMAEKYGKKGTILVYNNLDDNAEKWRPDTI